MNSLVRQVQKQRLQQRNIIHQVLIDWGRMHNSVDQPTLTLVSFRQQECALVTGVSWLLARSCGTVYQLSCVSQMSR